MIRKQVLGLSPIGLGYIVMSLVLLIWSGFALTIRAVSDSPLSIIDVALIRFSVPLILLSPLLIKYLDVIKSVRTSDVLFILLGGVPFLLLSYLGAKTAPTAYVGTILAGASPLFVAVLCYVFYSQKITKQNVYSLSLILVGIVMMICGRESDVSDELLKGISYLGLASLVWASYIIGLKRAAISAIAVAIILSYLSFFIVLLLAITGVLPSNFGSFSFQEALPFILVQGVGVGFLATISFTFVVNQLGSARTSAIGSLSPAITALLAVPVFGEPLTMAIVCGIGLTIIGVVLSNR